MEGIGGGRNPTKQSGNDETMNQNTAITGRLGSNNTFTSFTNNSEAKPLQGNTNAY